MWSNIDIAEGRRTGQIFIDECETENITSASYLLRLGKVLLEYSPSDSIVDTHATDTTTMFIERTIPSEGIVLNPGHFYLASTFERISLQASVAGLMCQRSSLARIGLAMHFSSIFVRPTFGIDSPSTLTLELISTASPIRIYAMDPICHLLFFSLNSPSDIIYRGRYTAATSPIPVAFSHSIRSHSILSSSHPESAASSIRPAYVSTRVDRREQTKTDLPDKELTSSLKPRL